MSTESSVIFWLGLLVVAGLFLVAISRGGRRQLARPDSYTTALTQIVNEDWDGALASLRRAIESGHTSPDAYIKLGSLLRRRGEHTAAFQIHQTLTVRTDLSVEDRNTVLRCLVDDYRALGRPDDALRILQQLAQGGRDPGIHREIAREALQSGQHDTAERAIREAQRLDGGFDRTEVARFLAQLGDRSLQRGQTAEAKRYLQEALKEHGQCEVALLRLGDLAYADADQESALFYWQRLAFAGPTEDPELYERLERVYFDLGKFGEIERVYAQILEKRPRDMQVLLASARIATKKGEMDEAEQLLRQALDVAPGSLRGFHMLATLLLEQGRTAEVRGLLDAHMEICRENGAKT